MRHIGPEELARLDGFCAQLRERPALRERAPGSFAFKSKAFLHFHEDSAGLFADVRLDGVSFERVEVTTAAQQRALLRRIDAVVNE